MLKIFQLGQFGRKVVGNAEGPPPADLSGALVRLSVDQDTTGASGLVTWDTETYDRTGYHSTSSNTERLTVPHSTVEVVRVIAQAQNNTLGDPLRLLLEKQGASFYGMVDGVASVATIAAVQNMASGPVEVDAAQWFNLDCPSLDTLDANEHTWFAIERIDSAAKRAMVRKSSTQSIVATTTTAITWSTEVYDIGGWFDTAVSTSRFTIPSGTSGYVRLSGSFDPGTVSGQRFMYLRRGSVDNAIGNAGKDSQSGATDCFSAVSAVYSVSAGDTFDMAGFFDNSATIQANEKTWFAIEEVLNFHGCLVYKSASQSISAGVEVAIAFAAESYDTDGAHDNVTNNTRITVPGGFTQARATFNINGPSAGGYFQGRVTKNGAAYHGAPKYNNETGGGDFVNAIGAWVDVTPGDYFELMVLSSAARTLAADNRTWLCVEFR